MKTVAVIAGGDSGEYGISVKSGAVVSQNIPHDKYRVFLIEIKAGRWIYRAKNDAIYSIDKNDFSLTIDGEKITFDVVFNAIHGTPGEDGKILAYFEMLGIPFTSTGSISSALTFNKAYCNQIVKNSETVKVSRSVHLFKNNNYSEEYFKDKINIPCFVKPNQGGSSVGMSKVNKPEDLLAAIKKAFDEDTEVLVEEFVSGRELTIGVFKYQGEILTFPITEVISKKEFFDFEAKYNPELNQEITPASIPLSLKEAIEKTAVQLYELLNLKGVVRFDFINGLNGLYFLEVNTVPGLSAESIVPKQVKERGWSIADLFDKMLQEALQS